MAQPGKRHHDGQASATRRRFRLNDVTLMPSRAPGLSGTAFSALADVVCSVLEYSQRASDFGAHFEEQDKLWQVQMVHDMRPSVTFDILRTFPAFMKMRYEDAGVTISGTFEDIERRDRVRLVLTGGDDPDKRPPRNLWTHSKWLQTVRS